MALGLERQASGLAEILRGAQFAVAGEDGIGRPLHACETLSRMAKADNVRGRLRIRIDAKSGAVRGGFRENAAPAVQDAAAHESVRRVVRPRVVALHERNEPVAGEPEYLPQGLMGEYGEEPRAEQRREEKGARAPPGAPWREPKRQMQRQERTGEEKKTAKKRQKRRRASRRQSLGDGVRQRHGGAAPSPLERSEETIPGVPEAGHDVVVVVESVVNRRGVDWHVGMLALDAGYALGA